MGNDDSGVFACGFVITFDDDGPTEETVLHKGSLEECKDMGRRLPAVSYSGDRPVRGAKFVIVNISDG